MKKKIAFVVSTLNNGGAQKIISNIVMALSEDWEIDIILNDTNDIIYPYKGKIIDLGFKPLNDKLNIPYQLKVFVKRICVLNYLKKIKRYDVCVSALESANIVNILTNKKYCKTVVTVHNNIAAVNDNWIYPYLVNPLAKLFYNRADKVITVSRGIEEALINNLHLNRKNICTIYNGYDIKDIQQMSCEELTEEESTWFQGDITVITVGRFVYQKAQWHLIRAMQNVVNKIPNARLIILGVGPLESYFKELVKECNLEDNIIFGGFRKNPFRVVAQSDMLVLSSMYEGFGNVLVESMACGVPCISTDIPSGPREILAPDTDILFQNKTFIEKAKYGVLVPTCDGVQYKGQQKLIKEEIILADAILEMATNEEMRRQYCSLIKDCVQKFDIKNSIKEWMKIL